MAGVLSVWGITVGDFGFGLVGMGTLVVTAFLTLYSKIKEERRVQLAKDAESLKDTWKAKCESLQEENSAIKNLLAAQREELELLRQRIHDIHDRQRRIH